MMPYENACSPPVRPNLSPPTMSRRWTLDGQLIDTQLIDSVYSSRLFWLSQVSLSDITSAIKTFLCGTAFGGQTQFRFCQLINCTRIPLRSHCTIIHSLNSTNWRTTIASWLNSVLDSSRSSNWHGIASRYRLRPGHAFQRIFLFFAYVRPMFICGQVA